MLEGWAKEGGQKKQMGIKLKFESFHLFLDFDPNFESQLAIRLV